MRPEKTGDITAATGENGASLIPDGAATVLPSPLSAVNPNSQSGEGTAIPSPTGEVTAVTAGKEFAVLGGTPAPAEDVRGMELTIRTMLAEISRLLQVLQHLVSRHPDPSIFMKEGSILRSLQTSPATTPTEHRHASTT